MKTVWAFFITLFLLPAVSQAAPCKARILSVLSKMGKGFKLCAAVNQKHFLVLSVVEGSTFLNLNVYESRRFSLQSQPVDSRQEVAEDLAFISGKTKKASDLSKGIWVGDLNRDGVSEILMSLALERTLNDLILLQLDSKGKIHQFKMTPKARGFFVNNRESEKGNQEELLKVIKVDHNTTVDIFAKSGKVVLGDRVHPKFRLVVEVQKNGTIEVN